MTALPVLVVPAGRPLVKLRAIHVWWGTHQDYPCRRWITEQRDRATERLVEELRRTREGQW